MTTPRFVRRKPGKLREGKGFPTLDALIVYLGKCPSVWYRASGKPMPSAFICSMQLRVVVKMWSQGQFASVVRP